MLESNLIKQIQNSDLKKLNISDEPSLKLVTEGIKYSGSKMKLLPHILSIVKTLPVHRVLDGFSGTTRVSQALAKNGYQVIANDQAYWSRVFGECYLKGQVTSKLLEKINYLNSLKGCTGWFTKYYGGYPNKGLSIQADEKKKNLANS